MSKFLLSFILLIFASSLIAQEAKHQYVGVDKCKICHKTEAQGNQFGIWESSKHAGAYKILLSDEAVKIAKEKGLTKAPSEAPECLKCHETAYNVDASMKAESFSAENGVQCESCHGAGADYRKMSIMKDRDASIKNGMNPIAISDGTAEKFCKTCHNSESPTFKAFDFAQYWEKIKHLVPEGGDGE